MKLIKQKLSLLYLFLIQLCHHILIFNFLHIFFLRFFFRSFFIQNDLYYFSQLTDTTTSQENRLWFFFPDFFFFFPIFVWIHRISNENWKILSQNFPILFRLFIFLMSKKKLKKYKKKKIFFNFLIYFYTLAEWTKPVGKCGK